MEFTHFLGEFCTIGLVTSFFLFLSGFSYFILLFWVLTLKPNPLVYCANAGKFLSLALF